MKPYYEDASVTIYHADCREALQRITAAPSLLVTDPPYGLNSAINTLNHRVAGDSTTELRDWCLDHFAGLAAIVFGSPKIKRPDNVRIVLIWDKGELTGMGDLNLPWKLTHEEIYVIGEGFKSERRIGSVISYHARPSWTNHPNALQGLHPTEKPVGLMTSLIASHPGEVIIDPFCGSGSTLRAAKDSGRRAIGIEIDERYCEVAAKRMQQEMLGLTYVPEVETETSELAL